MNETPHSRQQTNHRVVIAVIALLLLAGAVGVGVWMFAKPKVLTTGYRWALYPAVKDKTVDGSSEQEKLSFDGNVKVLSLLYEEDYAGDDTGPLVQSVACHVLIDLPAEAILQVTGGGVDEDNFIYRKVKVVFPEVGETPLPDMEIHVRFSPSDRWLQVLVESQDTQKADIGRKTINTRHIVSLKISEDAQVVAGGVSNVGEHVDRELNADDVRRLMEKLSFK